MFGFAIRVERILNQVCFCLLLKETKLEELLVRGLDEKAAINYYLIQSPVETNNKFFKNKKGGISDSLINRVRPYQAISSETTVKSYKKVII